MEGPRERPHMGLIYFVMCHAVGGVADVSTMGDLGRNGDTTVSLCGLPRPTPVSGSIYDI